jgi:hypothetical protein
MESNNSTIGYIDKLMIQRKAESKDFLALQKKINRHTFSPNNPLIILHTVQRREKSSLSNASFRITDEHEVIFNSANPLNKKRNLIDHCTEWQEYNDIPDTNILVAKFYDKDALLTTLNTLNKK